MIPLPETCAEYQYLFNSYYGPVWRNDSRDWNGSKPIETRMLYTADQMRAYGDAVRSEALEQAAMIVQENAEHCRGPIRSILLANATALRNYRAQDKAV